MRYDDRMSDFDRIMWVIEKNPLLRSTITAITVLDRTPDRARVMHRVDRATRNIPRLRQRVVWNPYSIAPPRWEFDPHFDLSYHVRFASAGGRNTFDDVIAFVEPMVMQSFDRDRPLWEFVVIEDLVDGQAALITKLHHSITDGQGGIRMSVQFIDFERDPGPLEPVTDGGDEGREEAAPPSASAATMEAVTATLAELTRTPRSLVRQAIEGATAVAADPTRLAAVPGDASAIARSLARQVGVTGDALSPLWRTRTLGRHLDLLRIPLDQAKAAAAALGGSVNDLFVAGAAGGAGAYHRAHDVPVEELRMAMPVSTRSKAEGRTSAGNAFAPTRVRVPVDPDPRRRFTEINQRLSVTKSERAVGLAAAVAGLGNLLPPPVLTRLVRQQTATVDFTTSNVRGAPFPLYIAGARILGNYPIGPLGGTAWNLTTMSVDGNLDMGLHVDTGAVAEPVLLRTCIEAAFDELLALA